MKEWDIKEYTCLEIDVTEAIVRLGEEGQIKKIDSDAKIDALLPIIIDKLDFSYCDYWAAIEYMVLEVCE